MAVVDSLVIRKGSEFLSIDSYDNEMIDEIIYEGQSFHFAKQKDLTGTSEIVADNGVQEPIISLGVSGATSQKSYEGYNLLNKEEFLIKALKNETELSAYGEVAIEIDRVKTLLKPSATYTISFEVEGVGGLPSGATFYRGEGFWLIPKLSGVAYIMKSTPKITSIGEIYSYSSTFTTPSNFLEADFKMYVYSGLYTLDGTNKATTCIFRNIQIVEGAEAKPYQQYVGGIPSPNPQYPQEIENANSEGMTVTVHGDNLLNKEEFAIKALRDETVLKRHGDVALSYTKINTFLKPNTNYVFTFEIEGVTGNPSNEVLRSGQGLYIWNSAQNKAYGFKTTKILNSGEIQKASYKFKTPADFYEQKFTMYSYSGSYGNWIDATCIIRNVQIVEGEEALPYQPYFRDEISIPASVEVEGATVELNMASISLTDTGGTYTATDYLTVDRLANKVLYHQNVGKRTLTSDMSWGEYNTGGKLLFFLRDNIGASRSHCPILANKYLGYRTVGFILSIDYGITTDAVWWGVTNRLTLRDTRFDNLADFKADLDQNPLLIEYGLAEPITHDITNTDLAQSLLALATGKGTNYLEITGNLAPSQTDLSYWRQIIPNE